MSIHPTALKQSLLAVLLTGFAALPLFGQAADSPVVFSSTDAVTTTFVDPPQVGRTDSSGNTGQWLKVEFHYACTPLAPLTFLDSAEFRIWIEGRDMFSPGAGADGVAVALTGTVTYVNIAANKDVYGVFYVAPATLARYSTAQGSTDYERKFNVHVEAYVNGAKMDLIDKTKEQDPNWYVQLRAIPALVYRQDQCPFLVSDVNKYPPIKLSVPAQ
jgi:hypothetical protein